MSATHLVRVIHAAQLVTMCPADPDQAFAVGEEAMGHVTIIEGERGSNIFFPVFLGFVAGAYNWLEEAAGLSST